jgi:phosphoglycerol transferase MdoB-like AlkP superfamily enzyme
LGYDYYACGRGLIGVDCNVWPESDLELIDATVDDYINDIPFHTYYITVSGHLGYSKGGNYMVKRNWNYVKDLDYSDATKSYIACNIELDKALELLLSKLEEKGILDDTVIVMTADHFPYGLSLEEMNEKSDIVLTEPFEKHRSTLVLWNNKVKKKVIDKYISNLDILPTVLNLFGVDYDSRLLMGTDILSDSEGLVIFSNRSFITKKGTYNSINNIFTPFDNQTVEEGYVSNMNETIKEKFYVSKEILEKNYYELLFGN